MKFSEILNELDKKYEVVLGYNNKEKLKINIKKNPSIIITGSTGTSKSIMMHQILLQLINKNNFKELKIIPVALTKVELEKYALSNYSYCGVISDKDIAIKIIKELIETRKNLFLENYVKNFDEYNNLKKDEKMPFIVIAIDEASDILNEEDSDSILLDIIKECSNLGISLILNTNNVYNNFFSNDINELANVRISFDFTSREDAEMNNIENSQNLSLRTFLIEIGKERYPNLYNVFDFDDEEIDKILNTKKG